jgi:lysozyme family protein
MKFDDALKLVLVAEGGRKLTNIPGDAGGLTYCGIALNRNPQWYGWGIFLRYAERISTDRPAGYADMRQEDKLRWFSDNLNLARWQETTELNHLDDAVRAFYKGAFWNICKCDELGELIRYPLFSCAVNCGITAAGKIFQRAIASPEVKCDGNIGPITVIYAKLCNQTALLARFYAEWQKYYTDIVARNPSFAKFAKGWENRIFNVKSDNK